MGSSPPFFNIMKKKTILLLILVALSVGVLMFFQPLRDADPDPISQETAVAPVSAPEGEESVPVQEEESVPVRETVAPLAPDTAEEIWARIEQYDHEPVPEDSLPEDPYLGPPASEEGFDAMPILSPAVQMSRTIENLQNTTLVPLDAYGRTMLSSTNATLRAMGGILMFKAGALNETLLQQLATDEDATVPLLVLEWIRDYGDVTMVQDLEELLTERNIDSEWLADEILAGGFDMGGGRVAVDVLADGLSPDECSDVLGEIASSPEAVYDLRMRSLLRLAEELDDEGFREALARVQEATADEGEDWEQAMDLLTMRVWDDEGSQLAARDEVTTRDLHLILENDYTYVARDAALYLGTRLRDPNVVVEPGTSDIVAEFIKDYPDQVQEWNVADEEAILRLITLHERLRALEDAEAAESEQSEPVEMPEPEEADSFSEK